MSKKAYYLDSDRIPVFPLAPGETDDYSVDFTAWLDGAVILGTPTVDTTTPGPTVDEVTVTHEGTHVTAFLTAAEDLARTIYTLVFTATDADGRTRPSTIRVEVAPRA